ncbi:hypothetical protein ACU6U9_17170 [Pseudomonas sp. HK3]
MYSNYFEGGEVKPEYTKTFISIFDGWLGEGDLHKLDKVTVCEWERFSNFIRRISQAHEVQVVDFETESFIQVTNIELLSSHDESKNKTSAEFTRIFIPALDCIITEDWDYTYILWCKNLNSIDILKPLIDEVGLFSFRD